MCSLFFSSFQTVNFVLYSNEQVERLIQETFKDNVHAATVNAHAKEPVYFSETIMEGAIGKLGDDTTSDFWRKEFKKLSKEGMS